VLCFFIPRLNHFHKTQAQFCLHRLDIIPLPVLARFEVLIFQFLTAEKTRRLSIEEAGQLRADDMEVLDTGEQKFIEEESITQPDGTIKWYQTTKVPLILNNSKDYLLGVAVDITHRKQTTDLLKEKESELEIKNKNLEELNAALKIVLQQKDADTRDLEKKVLSNIKTLVEPYLKKLENL